VRDEILARGATLRQAFAEAALGIFALTVDPAALRECEVREVRAHGASLEALLVHWIGECRYVQEIEGFGCHAIDFVVFDVEPQAGGEPLRLHALLRGEVDAEGAQPGTALAPVSTSDIAIRLMAEGYEIRVVVET
jgi:SHS2 domain-containing protein